MNALATALPPYNPSTRVVQLRLSRERLRCAVAHRCRRTRHPLRRYLPPAAGVAGGALVLRDDRARRGLVRGIRGDAAGGAGGGGGPGGAGRGRGGPVVAG